MFSQNQTNTETTFKHPIPPPTHQTQYRAIGLVWGTYRPKDQLTRGRMTVSEQASVETVLLGRAISVVKNHINLDKPHLWVVYPRTRQKQDYLHLQIVGIWEPTTLHESSQRAEQLHDQTVSEVNSQAGYFSIRGELIFYSEAQQKIIIKIKRGGTEKPTFFKLKLNGTLPDESEKLGWFWDLDAQLKGEELVVTKAQKIAPLNRNKKRAPNQKNSAAQQKETASQDTTKPRPISRRTKSRSQGKKQTKSN